GGRAAFPDRARARIDARLMQRVLEDGVVSCEGILRAVAVMDVEVDDRDPLHAVLGLHVACGHRDVVEEAEAHAAYWRRMVAGRSDEREVSGLGRLDRAT